MESFLHKVRVRQEREGRSRRFPKKEKIRETKVERRGLGEKKRDIREKRERRKRRAAKERRGEKRRGGEKSREEERAPT